MAESVKGYVLGEELGAGGMGRVFATQATSARRLVLKLLHEALQGDPFFVNRFLEEARAARAVQHRNVVRVVDDGLTAAGLPYLVMERIDGMPLGAMVRRDGPLPLQRIKHIASQILAGLGAIHRAGFVHGDLKSDNILVDAHDRVTIIDFGLARSTADASPHAGEMISGTPEYMAPELVEGAALSPASEVYAVGVIIYEMLTGTTPFTGGTCTEVCMRIVRDDVVPPSLRAPDRDIPVPLESTVMRALSRDPKSRHLSAGLFAAAVECAIPAGVKESLKVPAGPVFSVAATTRNWTQQQREIPFDNHPIVRHRHAVADALEVGAPDAVIVAYLALAQQLVQVHNPSEAIRELEVGIEWLESNAPKAADLWRLVVTLGALRRLVRSRHREAR